MNKRSGTESKKKILCAAARVFSRHEYKGASMRMMAKESGVSLGGLYLYFKNKEDLYGTVIRKRLDDLNAKTREMLDSIEEPSEEMRAFVEMRLDYARRHRELILVQAREHGFTFGIKDKKKFFREQRRIVEEIIRKGIASGAFKKCDVAEVAKIIICTLRGFVLSLIIEVDALFSPRVCSDFILGGLTAKPGAARRATQGWHSGKQKAKEGYVN